MNGGMQMIIKNKAKTIIVAGMLSLALTVPVLTPAASVIPGAPSITNIAQAKSLTVKEAKSKIKEKLKANGKWKKSYRIDYIKSEDGYRIFFIVKCSSCCGCTPVGYADVKSSTGKVYYKFYA